MASCACEERRASGALGVVRADHDRLSRTGRPPPTQVERGGHRLRDARQCSGGSRGIGGAAHRHAAREWRARGDDGGNTRTPPRARGRSPRTRLPRGHASRLGRRLLGMEIS